MRGGHLLSALLVVALAITAAVVAQRVAVSFDWTAGNRNSLGDASLRVLDALDEGAITFTAYIPPGPSRASVRNRLARYTRASAAISLEFLDPALHPQTVRDLGIGTDGAVVIGYRGRRQTITDYSEARITRALQHLSAAGDQWVVFLGGHGERDPADESRSNYSRLAAALDAQGLTTRTLNLADSVAIPDNTAVLVIASPQQALLPGEVDRIREFVADGGALLWADDPGQRYGLTPLAEDLGLEFRPGTLIYPDYQSIGTRHPAITVVANYPDTPITNDLAQIGLFPYAGALSVGDNPSWRTRTLLRSATRSWLETDDPDGERLTFEPDRGDVRGPLPFGVALQRDRITPAGEQVQRGVVVADSDFMSNAYIDMLGNRTLALSIFQWLSFRDAQIAIDSVAAPDATLEITPAGIRRLWWVFVVAVPLILLGLGLARWWHRRRR